MQAFCISRCILHITAINVINLKKAHFYQGSRGPSEDWVFLRFQWRPSWMLRRKSLVESTEHAVGTGQGAMLHTSASPGPNCFLSFPSNDTHAWLLLLKGTTTLSVTCSGNIRGRNDREWGQIGVNNIPGTCKYIYSFIPLLTQLSEMMLTLPVDGPWILRQQENMLCSQMSSTESDHPLVRRSRKSCRNSIPNLWGTKKFHGQLLPHSELA